LDVLEFTSRTADLIGSVNVRGNHVYSARARESDIMQMSRALAVAACAGFAFSTFGVDASSSSGSQGSAAGSRVNLLPLPPSHVDAGPRAITFAHGMIDTRSARPFSALAEPIVAGARYLVQLDGPITPARRASMVGAGLSIGDYLPSFAYIVRIDRADAQALAGLGFVRYVTPFEDSWKLSPELGVRPFQTAERLALRTAGQSRLVVTLFDGEPADAALAHIAQIPGAVVTSVQDVGTQRDILVTMPSAGAPALASVPSVQFVEDAPELTFRNSTTAWIIQSNASGSTTLWNNGLRGQNQIVGVMDGKLDRNHCSFTDTDPIGPLHRKIIAYNTTAGSESHGTHVSGTAAGDAGVAGNTRGIAYEAKIAFDDIPSFTDAAMYANLQTHHNQGARSHTNSWGDDGTVSYNSLCRGVDRFSYDFEDSLVMFAVTNTSTLKNPENAKNLVGVGASQDTPNQGNFCSGGAGPTADGRRKPEVYAPGCSTTSASSGTTCSTVSFTGTSMASPAIGGLALLLRQYYTDGYYPSGAATPSDAFTPTAALVKATLINSSVDMSGITGYPSNSEGWGRALADEALYFSGETRRLIVGDVRNADGLSTGEFDEIPIQVNSSAQKLKVTMVFTDPPASASTGTANAAINNLDLEVVSPSGTVYKGNVFTSGQSSTGGTADAKNNVEQVHINSPATGEWTVRVKATAVSSGLQGYAVATSGVIDPPTPPASIEIAGSAVNVIEPGEETTIDVVITPNNDTMVGTPTISYRFDGGSFTTDNLVDMGGGVWRGTLPATLCETTPEYYFSATGATSGVNTLPDEGAAAPFASDVGTLTPILDDTFATDQGWGVGALGDAASAGVWVRSAPSGGLGAPTADHTGDPETMAFITGSSTDVDGGLTTLLTPIMDMSAPGEYRISYWRWYSNDAGTNPNADSMIISISNNGGSSWTTVENVGPAGEGTAGGWINFQFDPATEVALTANMRMRFIAGDLSGDSNIEAGIDDFVASRFSCTNPSDCPADYNGDTTPDVLDFLDFMDDFGTCDGQAAPCGSFGDPDLNGDTQVDVLDFLDFMDYFGTGCT
jgi:hypothetical protein